MDAIAEISEKIRKIEWTEAHHKAAQLLAEGELTQGKICEQLGINPRTLWAWKQVPEFVAEVKAIGERLGSLAERYAIGLRASRIKSLQKLQERMERLVEARAEEHAGVKGGDTGLLAKDVKAVGKSAVDIYRFDAALARELRETQKQAAIELGQWTERSQVDLGKLTNEQLLSLLEATDAGTTGSGSEEERPADPTASEAS